MMFEFKQALRIDRKTFPLGVHEVPEEIKRHPHFDHFRKAGMIMPAGANKADLKLSDLPVLPAPASATAKLAAQVARQVQANAEVSDEAEIDMDQPKRKKGK